MNSKNENNTPFINIDSQKHWFIIKHLIFQIILLLQKTHLAFVWKNH